jgi:hypothetical protein
MQPFPAVVSMPKFQVGSVPYICQSTRFVVKKWHLIGSERCSSVYCKEPYHHDSSLVLMSSMKSRCRLWISIALISHPCSSTFASRGNQLPLLPCSMPFPMSNSFQCYCLFCQRLRSSSTWGLIQKGELNNIEYMLSRWWHEAGLASSA